VTDEDELLRTDIFLAESLRADLARIAQTCVEALAGSYLARRDVFVVVATFASNGCAAAS